MHLHSKHNALHLVSDLYALYQKNKAIAVNEGVSASWNGCKIRLEMNGGLEQELNRNGLSVERPVYAKFSRSAFIMFASLSSLVPIEQIILAV